jgi:hypothetical protein
MMIVLKEKENPLNYLRNPTKILNCVLKTNLWIMIHPIASFALTTSRRNPLPTTVCTSSALSVYLSGPK